MAGAIAERLTAVGKAPPQSAIRTELDGGSFPTIGEALKQWCKLKAEEQHLQVVDIPENIRDRMAQLQDAMWKTATTKADLRIQAERQTLNEEKAQSTTILTEAREAIRTLKTESAQLHEKPPLAEATLQSTRVKKGSPGTGKPAVHPACGSPCWKSNWPKRKYGSGNNGS